MLTRSRPRLSRNIAPTFRRLVVESLEDRRLLAAQPSGIPSTGVYDENELQPNTVDVVAAGSDMTPVEFAADLQAAFAANAGGVIDGSGLGLSHTFGADHSKRLTVRAADGTNWGIGAPTSPLPISGTGAFASSRDGGYEFTSLDFESIEFGDADEQVIQFGVTVLSRDNRDYGNVTVAGRLASGQTLSASHAINAPTGAGDTFFGLAAPDGDYFTGFSLSYDGTLVSPLSLWFDDIGFITNAVAAPNRAPLAVDDAYSVAEDATLVVVAASGVLANDADPDGDALAAVLASGPEHGDLEFSSDGAFVYTPDADFNGADAFAYRANDGSLDSALTWVSLTVAPVNDPPVAADDAFTIDEDGVLTAAGQQATVVDQLSLGDRAIFSIGAAGSWQQPVIAGVSGTLQSIDVHIANGTVGDELNFFVNAGPAWQSDTPDFQATIPIDSSMVDQWITIDVSEAEIHLSRGEEFVFGASESYAIFFTGSADFIEDSYAPTRLWRNGNPYTDSGYDFRFRTHMQISLPAGVLLNDTDVDGDVLEARLVSGPAHGSLTLESHGGFVYTPDADYFGADQFTYEVTDGTASSTATAAITVAPVNDAPTVADLNLSVRENTPRGTPVGAVVAEDIDSPALSYSISGPDSAAFEIVESTGALVVADASLLDFESRESLHFQVTVSDGARSATADVQVALVDVVDTIDIVPGDESNQIRLKDSRIAVAILSTEHFDAATAVDVHSLTFGATGDESSLIVHRKRGPRVEYRDVNGDGLLDLVAYFSTKKTGLTADSTDAVLKGMLTSGAEFRFEDAIDVIARKGKGKGKRS